VDPSAYVRTISDLASRREPFAVASVVRTEGSTLGKPGFKVVISKDGNIVHGTLGGGCPDGPIVAVGLETLETGTPRVVRVHLVDVTQAVHGTVAAESPDDIYVETNCGGTMEIYVEPYLPPHRLVIVGQGGRDELEDQLVHFGKRLGYEVVVVDHLPGLTEKPDQLIAEMDYDLAKFPFGPRDAVVVLTKGERDLPVLVALSRVPLAYVGMLSSRSRTQQNFAALRADGVPESFLASLHTPIGLDLGARTPAEIALAILAEIVAVRQGHHLQRHAGSG
jgi:xanthine dehydrogenase accessory factor